MIAGAFSADYGCNYNIQDARFARCSRVIVIRQLNAVQIQPVNMLIGFLVCQRVAAAGSIL